MDFLQYVSIICQHQGTHSWPVFGFRAGRVHAILDLCRLRRDLCLLLLRVKQERRVNLKYFLRGVELTTAESRVHVQKGRKAKMGNWGRKSSSTDQNALQREVT
jgi:hypothetical protein